MRCGSWCATGRSCWALRGPRSCCWWCSSRARSWGRDVSPTVADRWGRWCGAKRDPAGRMMVMGWEEVTSTTGTCRWSSSGACRDRARRWWGRCWTRTRMWGEWELQGGFGFLVTMTYDSLYWALHPIFNCFRLYRTKWRAKRIFLGLHTLISHISKTNKWTELKNFFFNFELCKFKAVATRCILFLWSDFRYFPNKIIFSSKAMFSSVANLKKGFKLSPPDICLKNLWQKITGFLNIPKKPRGTK